MNTLPQKEEIEGNNFSVICEATYGNPNVTIFFWTKTNDLSFRQNRSTLQLPNIQRTSAGTYVCTAENIYSNGEKGTHNQSMILYVICKYILYKLLNYGFFLIQIKEFNTILI